MKWNHLSMVLCLTFFACGSEVPQEKEAPQVKVPVNEEDLLARLSMQLIAKPQLQAHHDQNTIVSYAIGELLDVQKTPSGIFYQIVKKGQSDALATRWGDIAHVSYQGMLLDGTIFDQSKAGEPLKVKLKQVIPGWQEAIPMLREGGEGIFLIPSYLAYGEEGFGNRIPPNTVLKFIIKLEKVDRY